MFTVKLENIKAINIKDIDLDENVHLNNMQKLEFELDACRQKIKQLEEDFGMAEINSKKQQIELDLQILNVNNFSINSLNLSI